MVAARWRQMKQRMLDPGLGCSDGGEGWSSRIKDDIIKVVELGEKASGKNFERVSGGPNEDYKVESVPEGARLCLHSRT